VLAGAAIAAYSFLGFDAVTHLLRVEQVRRASADLGIPDDMIVVCGAVLGTLVVAYLMPATRAMAVPASRDDRTRAEEHPMKFMTMVHETHRPTAEPPAALGGLQASGTADGTLVEIGGLAPIEHGAVVTLTGRSLTTTDGPFVEVKELVGGYAVYEVRDLAGAHPATRLVVLANRPSPAECNQMLAFGATACLSKETQARDVLSAIHLASRGLHVLPRSAAADHPAVLHQHRAHRHLPERGALVGQGQRLAHEVLVLAAVDDPDSAHGLPVAGNCDCERGVNPTAAASARPPR